MKRRREGIKIKHGKKGSGDKNKRGKEGRVGKDVNLYL
jgi:hypothetical protein